jgi:His/Glu/Gln/Arg/opine family amino acid ABC transporter permease subunit
MVWQTAPTAAILHEILSARLGGSRMTEFDSGMMLRAAPVLLDGMTVTLEIGVLAIVLSLAWGLAVVLCRISAIRPVTLSAAGYIQLVRNTPVLVQMYLFYFGLAMYGLRLSGFEAGLLAMVMQNGGYIAEIYRAGIAGVSPGQREAGHALGMRPARTFRLVILPQALRLVIAPLGNQFLVIMKDTALVSTLSVAEMTFQARLLIDRTAAAYEIFLTLALLYLVLNGLLAGLMRTVEWYLRPGA